MRRGRHTKALTRLVDLGLRYLHRPGRTRSLPSNGGIRPAIHSNVAPCKSEFSRASLTSK
jgi:hypothetical protein